MEKQKFIHFRRVNYTKTLLPILLADFKDKNRNIWVIQSMVNLQLELQKPEPHPEPQRRKPETINDPMVGSIDDKIRLLQIEQELLKLKLAKTIDKDKTESYYQ